MNLWQNIIVGVVIAALVALTGAVVDHEIGFKRLTEWSERHQQAHDEAQEAAAQAAEGARRRDREGVIELFTHPSTAVP